MEQQELLQALRGIIREELTDIESRMDTMQKALGETQKALGETQKAVVDTQTSVRHLGVLYESLDKKVQLIYENQVDIIEMKHRIDLVEQKQELTDTDIAALKLAVAQKVG